MWGIARASEAYPECTFTSCPQCLLDVKTSWQNLSITGADTLTYQSPLRIGRSPAYWDSQSLVAQMVGILVKEKLGINVEYVPCEDETTCTFATCACAGYEDSQCNPVSTLEQAKQAVRDGTKRYPEPTADIFFFTEDYEVNLARSAFEATNLDFDKKPITVLGPAGYTSVDGVYHFPELYEEAWERYQADTDSLRAFTRPEVRNLTDPPIRLVEDGVEAEFPSCVGNESSLIESSMEYHRERNWTCNEHFWWVNPACAKYGDDWMTECLVLLEDDWGYSKPDIYDFFALSEVPVAKLMVGYDPWWELTYYKAYNVLFTWWRPDASILNQDARRVNMPHGEDISPSIPVKVGYQAAMRADDRLTAFLTAVAVDEAYILDLMEVTSQAYEDGWEAGEYADSFYQKLACDWLRSNEVWSDWLSSANSCSAGEYYDEETEICEECPTGTAGATTLDGDLYCKACEIGTYAEFDGLTACIECPKGSYVQESGRTVCDLCPTGTYGNTTGLTACTVCEAGTAYPRTTDGRGMSSASDCKCGEGSYESPNGSECAACPEGMDCEFGSSFDAFATWSADDETSEPIPLVSVGYFTESSHPLTVFLCDSSAGTDHCPGGGPGTCGNGRVGLVCSRCPAGQAPTEDNGCSKCDSPLTYLGLSLVPVVLLALVFGIAWLSKDALSQTQSTLSSAVSLGLLLTGLQSLGVFDQISVNWANPIKTLVGLGRLFSFNLNLLKASCVLGGNPAVSFSFRLLLAPAMLPVIGLVTWRRTGCQGLFPELVNNVGTCFNIVFISIVVSCTIPFVCYSHPSGSYSMRSMPSILCWTGSEFLTMAILGITAFLLVPLPFTAIAAYGSWAYPVLIKRRDSNVVLQALRFLFVKYTPSCFFYTPILLLRNLLISLVAVVFLQPATQILSLCLLFSFFTCIQVCLQPWRSNFINLADASLSVLLQTVLVSGAMVSGIAASDDSLSVINVMMVLALSVVALGLLAWNVILLARAKGQKYSRFICHHKASAAAQARLLKMYLTTRSQSVFIDSDDLDDLDSLFEIVKTKVITLVVYLTRDTLRRPWCAGEITTAFKASKVKVLTIWTPSFHPPTQRDMEDLQSYVDESGCRLKQYGIFWDAVHDSFQQLVDKDTTPRIRLAHSARLLTHYTTLSTCIYKGTSCDLFVGEKKDQLGELQPDHGQVVVSADAGSDEAAAAAGILVLKLREKLFVRDGCDVPVCSLIEKNLEDLAELAACAHLARAVVIMLSEGSLTNFFQLCVIIEATQHRHARSSDASPGFSSSRTTNFWQNDRAGSGMGLQESQGVIPLMLSGFRFPTDEFYRNALPRVISDCTEEMRRRIRSFFNLIALPFSTHLSDSTLGVEVGKVLDRIPIMPTGISGMSKSTSTHSIMKTSPVPGLSRATSEVMSEHLTGGFNTEQEDPSRSRSIEHSGNGSASGVLKAVADRLNSLDLAASSDLNMRANESKTSSKTAEPRAVRSVMFSEFGDSDADLEVDRQYSV